MDLSGLYVWMLGFFVVFWVQVLIGCVLGYIVCYVIFRLFRRRLSIKNYLKLVVSLALDAADFIVVIPGFDIPWDIVLGLFGVLFWGWKIGWVQGVEILPIPGDGFVPSLTISGFIYILRHEKRA